MPQAVEEAAAAVIDAALRTRPLRAAKHYYRNVALRLAGTGSEPPSRSIFERMFAAERKRLKVERSERIARAAAELGDIAADGLAFIPCGPLIERRQCELVVTALASFRTPGPLDAYRDYLQMSHRADVRSIRQDDFRALVVAPLFVGNVPHGLMPDWWRKKIR